MKQAGIPDFASWYKGKTVLVTGASSGIGREMVRWLGRFGSSLLLSGRDRGALQALADEIKSRGGRVTDIYLVDLAEEKAVNDLCGGVVKHHPVDILINNAGFGDMADFSGIKEETYRSMMEVNMRAVVSLCRCFLPEMLNRSGTGILNVGSVASFFPTPHSALYGATKHFILGFTDALHEEVRAKGVHVTGLYPGKTMTRFIARATSGKVPQWDSAALPEQVAWQGLKGLSENQVRVIPGVDNQLKVWVSRLLPIEMLLKKTGQNSPS